MHNCKPSCECAKCLAIPQIMVSDILMLLARFTAEGVSVEYILQAITQTAEAYATSIAEKNLTEEVIEEIQDIATDRGAFVGSRIREKMKEIKEEREANYEIN